MIVYRGLSSDTLEAEYNLTARRGADDFAALVERWLERSARQRERANARVDMAYGPGERERLDLFSGGDANGPLLVYIHGGYWQRGDKDMYSFVTESFVRHGVSVAVLNYTLTPAVCMGEIPPQIRRAIRWLWNHAADLGYSRERLHVMGHSAGGHLTAMMMATDWPAFDAQLPVDLVKSGIPVSGVFDLEPIVHTTLNTGPRMTVDEAKAESPLFMTMATDAPQLVVDGGGETDEFHRQSDAYVERVSSDARPVERYVVPHDDHFDELHRLAEDDSDFFGKSLRLITESAS